MLVLLAVPVADIMEGGWPAGATFRFAWKQRWQPVAMVPKLEHQGSRSLGATKALPLSARD